MSEVKLAELAKQLMPYLPIADVVTVTTAESGAGGVTDHGALSGLADDDHDQYTRGVPDTLTVSTTNVEGATHTHAITHTHNPGAAAHILSSDTDGSLELVTDLLVVNGATMRVSINDASPSAAALHVFSDDVDDMTLVVKQRASQNADLFRILKSDDTDLIRFRNDGSIESGAVTFASGVSGWRITASGDAEFNNIRARGAIRASVFEYGDIQATAGTLMISKSATKLNQDFTSPATVDTTGTIYLDNDAQGTPLVAVDDILRMKYLTATGVAQVWLEVDSVVDSGDYATVGITLRSGDTSTTFRKGTGIVVAGTLTGGGIIYLSADGVIGSAANISITEHTGAPWTTEDLWVRIGNMNGSFGTGANDRYGIGIGDYSNQNYLSYNAETVDSLVFMCGGGGVSFSTNGIEINNPTGAYNRARAITWNVSGTAVGDIYMLESTYRYMHVTVDATSKQSTLYLESFANATYGAHVLLMAGSGGTGADYAYVELTSDSDLPTVSTVSLTAENITIAGYGATATTLILVGGLRVSYGINPGSGDIFAGGTIRCDEAFRTQGSGIGSGATGGGVEVSWESTYGRVLAYNRTSSSDVGLQLRGSFIDFYEATTPVFRIDGGVLQKYVASAWRTTEQVVFDRMSALSGWEGTGRSDSTGSWTEANLGIPEGAKAVYLRVAARDSGTFPQDIFFAVGRDGSTYDIAAYPPGNSGGTEIFGGATGWVQFSSGTVNWRVNASGTGTMDVWVWVLGYAM